MPVATSSHLPPLSALFSEYRDDHPRLVTQWRRLQDAKRQWKRANEKTRALTAYPTQSSFIDDTPALVASAADPPRWSLFPSCPSVSSKAAERYQWRVVSEAEPRASLSTKEDKVKMERVKVEKQ
jgi:hypothetical protein